MKRVKKVFSRYGINSYKVRFDNINELLNWVIEKHPCFVKLNKETIDDTIYLMIENDELTAQNSSSGEKRILTNINSINQKMEAALLRASYAYESTNI